MSDVDWPLSAVATELLRGRPVGRQRALVLSLKELVVSGTWRLTTQAERRLLGTRDVPLLGPGDAPAPPRPPLPVLDARLRHLVPARAELRTLAPSLLADADLVGRLLHEAESDLLRRGLVTRDRGLFGPRVRRTPDGDAWVGGLAAKRHGWEQALAAGGVAAERAVEELGRAPGLVPLLDRRRLREVDDVVRRLGGADTSWGGGVGWGDGSAGLDSCFASLDGGGSGFDSGGSDSGGGDGGGGGD